MKTRLEQQLIAKLSHAALLITPTLGNNDEDGDEMQIAGRLK